MAIGLVRAVSACFVLAALGFWLRYATHSSPPISLTLNGVVCHLSERAWCVLLSTLARARDDYSGRGEKINRRIICFFKCKVPPLSVRRNSGFVFGDGQKEAFI